VTFGVVLSDDHPLLLRGLCDLLGVERDFTLIGATTSGQEALALIRERRPEIGVIDVSMPGFGGMDILRAVATAALEVKIIFLTATITSSQIAEALDLGVSGLLLKESAPETLINCLREVSSGGRWLPEELVSRASNQVNIGRGQPHIAKEALTRRETEIVELVCRGFSNKMIALELGSSAGTVKIHLQNIYQKLQIPNRTALASLSLTLR